MVRHVVFDWGVSSVHGWGVYGLNLALAWAADPEIAAATSAEIDRRLVLVDPLQWHALASFRARSANLRRQVMPRTGETLPLKAALLAGFGNDLMPSAGPHGGALRGAPHVGVAFVESEDLGPRAGAAQAE